MENILILSAGRRVELVQSFQNEVKARKLDAQVISADANSTLAPASYVSDKFFNCPFVNDPNYINYLIRLCIENKIGLIIPTIDTELIVLANNIDKFEAINTNVVLSNLKFINYCRNKILTTELFKKMDIKYPKLYNKANLKFPCFIKPLDGSNSKNISIANSINDIPGSHFKNEKMIFMEFVGNDFCEFTIDAYFSRTGTLKCIVPRERLKVRGGEVSKAITRKNFIYDILKDKLIDFEGAKGCITIQVFGKESTKEIIGIEINPRFGGGFPLSYSAGANYPGWLIDEYLFGLDISFFEDWSSNLLMLRYDSKVLIHDFN